MCVCVSVSERMFQCGEEQPMRELGETCVCVCVSERVYQCGEEQLLVGDDLPFELPHLTHTHTHAHTPHRVESRLGWHQDCIMTRMGHWDVAAVTRTGDRGG